MFYLEAVGDSGNESPPSPRVGSELHSQETIAQEAGKRASSGNHSAITPLTNTTGPGQMMYDFSEGEQGKSPRHQWLRLPSDHQTSN
jgi:hypothetical protein